MRFRCCGPNRSCPSALAFPGRGGCRAFPACVTIQHFLSFIGRSEGMIGRPAYLHQHSGFLPCPPDRMRGEQIRSDDQSRHPTPPSPVPASRPSLSSPDGETGRRKGLKKSVLSSLFCLHHCPGRPIVTTACEHRLVVRGQLGSQSREVGVFSASRYARVVKSVDTRDLNNLSPPGETPEVKPVKVGERPGCLGIRANAEPSPSRPAGKV